MDDNPYAPPRGSTDTPPDGLVFSPEGVEVVADMAKWMRALSTFYYVVLALVVLGGGCASLGVIGTTGARGILVLIVVALFCGLIALPAVWLRDAAGYFEHGVAGDDEFNLGQGFRKLRAYFIFFGIIGILGLLSNIIEAIKVL